MSYREKYDRGFAAVAFLLPASIGIAGYIIAIVNNLDPWVGMASSIPLLVSIVCAYGYRTELENE